MTKNTSEVGRLEEIARRIRVKVVKMIARSGIGHGGGSMSIAELLAVLYFHEMKVDPKNPSREDRDRFVLSKGHGCPALYAALSEAGYFDEAVLATLHHADGPLQMHPELGLCPGVEMSSGALGQGLSVGIGMALASRLSGVPFRVYVCIGDGESAEGQIWEAAMCASKYKLDNLVGILDYNKFTLSDNIDQVMPLEPVRDKWKAFGWNVLEADGHSVAELMQAFRRVRRVKGKPSMVVMHTVKGKGMRHVENTAASHSVSFSLEEVEKLLFDLNCQIDEIRETLAQLKEKH